MIDFKYAAGFIDADGSIQIHAKKFGDRFSIYPVVSITQLPHRSNLLHDIADFYGISVHRNGRGTDEVRISGKKGANLLEHVCKHMVIKQELARYILDLPKMVEESELKAIKSVIKNLRRNNTPCKHRASRRWAAGYIDGDGCISASVSKNGSFSCRLSVSSWKHAQAGLFLLKEQFGGYIIESGNAANWRVNLSPSKVQEVSEFLGKHLRIKKTQLELANEFIGKNKHSRRMGATDETLRDFCETLATTKSISIRKDDVIV